MYQLEEKVGVEVRNTAQILYGKSLDEVNQGVSIGKQMHFKRLQDIKEYKKHSIWTHLTSLA